MQIIPQFVPVAGANGVIQVGAADAGSKLLLYNKSPYDLQLDFYNGKQSLAHAKQARYWTLDGDTKQVGWSIPSSQNVNTPAQNVVQGELYSPTEQLEGVFPVQLDIQTDASNNLIGVNQAGFGIKVDTQNTGATLNCTIPHTVGKTTYVLGFTFSCDAGSARIDHQIILTGLGGTPVPNYFATATTTIGALLDIRFPQALPALTAITDVSVTLNTTLNSTGTLVAYYYQVATSTATSSGGSSTVSGIATELQNDGNSTNTLIIESTVIGDGSSAVTLTNDAIMVLGDAAHKGSLTTAGPVNVGGALAVTGVTNTAGVLNANGGLNTNTLRDDTNGNTALDMSAGTGDVTMPHTLTIGTQLVLPVGTLTKIAQFGPYTVGAAAAFFNHNLGVVPDLILLVQSTNAGVHAISYESTTMTTTQVSLLAGAANTIVRGLAIKF